MKRFNERRVEEERKGQPMGTWVRGAGERRDRDSREENREEQRENKNSLGFFIIIKSTSDQDLLMPNCITKAVVLT